MGGGTAGNAVATRISQDLPDLSVLVIEAGPFAPYEDRINIPGMKGSTLGTIYDWNFTSIPQTALDDRIITQSRGKVLGGTSAINLLIWDRGSKPEYDAWGQVSVGLNFPPCSKLTFSGRQSRLELGLNDQSHEQG